MDTISHVALSLAAAMRRELEVTANNIANANTSGFKSERVVFENYVAAGTAPDGGSDFVIDAGSYVDLRAGALTNTGNPLDVALNGPGWLAYRTEDGRTAYGRDGRFMINGDGNLVTVTGAQVLDEGGGPISVPPDAGAVEIAADGTLSSEAGVALARIGVFDLPSIQSFERLGGGLFVPPQGARSDAVPSLDTSVVQGALEGSNVQPILEMTRLMDIQKAYERATQINRTHDELARDAIRRIGRQS
ncbi:flagellar basal-body rod protein FlgF [Roseibacterium sp. SDUM158016]|uniref:flagellar basal-body rod protein FlgF n=1 Tax=Roseicyclus sediminis TaxID=2980997 RepID=UPI0021CE4240|nr:flagellar basal-body rod protein FlgF [Roseibacterium sp. SDUM158016]MCU4654337.1 flagellar basal-body rod protein FlgF [Roseibacterium sp. SDUM158016]